MDFTGAAGWVNGTNGVGLGAGVGRVTAAGGLIEAGFADPGDCPEG
jgi:hypothetical protein